MRFYFDHQLYMLFQQHVGEPDRTTCVNKRPIAKEYIYIYTVDVQIKRPFCDVVHFCQMFDVFFCLYNPPPTPLDPRHPLHMLYMYIGAYHCPKGILGLGGGGASKNKLKDTCFILSMRNVTISVCNSYACAEGIPKSFGIEE